MQLSHNILLSTRDRETARAIARSCETVSDTDLHVSLIQEAKAILGRSGLGAVVLVYAYARADGKPPEDLEKDFRLLGAFERKT